MELETQLALILKRLDDIEKQLVTKDEFDPIKKIVYAGVSLILGSVGAAIIALVLQR